MSWDLSFAVRPGKTAPSIAELRAYFAARPHWRVDDDSAAYAHPHTGTRFDVSFGEPGEDDPKDRAPLTFWIGQLRPHVVAYEARDEIAALVRAFDLLVDDPQKDGMGKGELDADALVRGYAAYSRWLHEVNLRRLAADPPPALPRDALERAWRWNYARDALSERSGDELFVPQIFYALDGGRVRTFIAWADGTAARLPEVDSIQTTQTHVPFGAIAEVLRDVRREDEPVPHWVVDGDAVRRVFEAIAAVPSAPPPRMLQAGSVCTKELVDEHALDPQTREVRRKATSLQRDGQLALHMGQKREGLRQLREAARLLADDADANHEIAYAAHEADDHLLAFETASRAFELKRQPFDALLAAANASYAARYDDALRYADALLQLGAEARNAHLIRAVSLTELARYDEAIAAADRALAIEWDPMVENCRAFALAAAGRDDDARASYARALEALDRALAESPEEADLHSRRAYALLGLGRGKEALAAAKQALKLEKDAFLSLQSLGRAFLLLDRPEEALVPLKKAIASRAAAPMAAFYAAKAHARLGDRDAVSPMLRAASASPHFTGLAATDPDLRNLGSAKKKPAAKKLASPKKKPAAKKLAGAKKKAPAPKQKAAAKKLAAAPKKKAVKPKTAKKKANARRPAKRR